MNKIQKLARSIIINELNEIYSVILILINDRENSDVLFLGLMPYISLVINEAANWCENSNNKIDSRTSEFFDLIRYLRTKNKFYTSDKYYTLVEQKERLGEIIGIEKTYFYNKNIKMIKKNNEYEYNDVGTYKINNLYIGNNILYSDYYRPLGENKDGEYLGIHSSGSEIFKFARWVPSAIYEIFLKISDEPIKNIQTSVKKNFKVIDQDFRLDKCFFYGGRIDKTILFNMLCSINYVSNIMDKILSKNSTLLFRIKYLIIYHILKDLKELNVISSYDSKFDNRIFRNSMAHYGLAKSLNIENINENISLFGLVENNLFISFGEMMDVMNENIKKLRILLSSIIEIC